MENKKIDVLFGLVVIAFLVVVIILIKDINSKSANDFKEYQDNITSIVKQKNNKIKVLSIQLAAKQKEINDLKNTLADTRNDIDTLSKKLAQQAPVAVPASAPEPAAAPAPTPTPAPAPTPATATK